MSKAKKARAKRSVVAVGAEDLPSTEIVAEPSHPSLHSAPRHPNLEVVRSSPPDEISAALGAHLIQAFRSQADAIYREAAHLNDRVMGTYDLASCPVLARLPRMAWDLRTTWRYELARAYDDLADDVAAGEWPDARCGGEEWALYRVIMRGDGDEAIDDDVRQHPESLRQVYDFLMEGEDLDAIFDATNGGGFLPRDSSMHPRRWFRPFAELPLRDPDRGFRTERVARATTETSVSVVTDEETETWWAAGS